MGVHAEGNGLVAMPQLLGYTGHISSVSDCYTDKGVAQLVGVKSRHVILLGKLLHISGRGLRVHRLRAILLSKDIGTDGVARLFQPEFPEQPNDLRVNINHPYLAALGCVQINTFLRCVTEVPPNRDCTNLEVDVFPLQPAALAPADTGVNEQTYQGAPFQRLIL